MRILFIRHALTSYDIAGPEGRFCGRSDPPLSEKGIQEARGLGEVFAHSPSAKVYTSPLARSVETANQIFGDQAISPVIEPLLSEIDYGDWEGLTKERVSLGFTTAFKEFSEDPVRCYAPGGEPPLECLKRAIKWLGELKDEYVIAVTHKTWTRLLLCHLLGIPLNRYRSSIDIKIASITVLTLHGNNWRMDALNYCATSKRILGWEVQHS